MADVILDDMRRKLGQIALTINDGGNVIQFTTEEEMNRFLEFRRGVEELYLDLVVNASE